MIRASAGSVTFATAGQTPDTGNNRLSAQAGEPVDTSQGTFTHSHTDLAIPGRGVALSFTRSYSSSQPALAGGSLGERWSHNYEARISAFSSSSVLVRYPDGGTLFFNYQAGTFIPPPGIFDTLVKNGDNTYTLTTTSQVRYNFDTGGRLTSIVDRNGNATTLTSLLLASTTSVVRNDVSKKYVVLLPRAFL